MESGPNEDLELVEVDAKNVERDPCHKSFVADFTTNSLHMKSVGEERRIDVLLSKSGQFIFTFSGVLFPV